jgi:hypothetical protein
VAASTVGSLRSKRMLRGPDAPSQRQLGAVAAGSEWSTIATPRNAECRSSRGFPVNHPVWEALRSNQ